jgi:membrane associated rhomboid family serine protease
MREPTSNWRFSATVTLIILLVVAFLLQHSVDPRIERRYLELSLEGIKSGYVWQLLTFQFLHSGILHLLFNCIALYSFGREVEATLEKPRFLTLYFLSGIMGGLFQVLLALISPTYFGGTVVGASAGIFGVIAAFAMLDPHRYITMLLFYVIPVNMRAIVLVYASLIFAALGIVFSRQFAGNGIQVAHGAHLAGILTGVAFIKFAGRLPERLWNPFQSRRRKRELIKAVSIKIPKWPQGRAEGPGELSRDEFISREVDPILDKISQHGIQSLTERERKILEAARSKMAKR